MNERQKIGLLIKRKRQLLDMSQEELAHKVGYKARTSVNKIEKGNCDIPPQKIKAFASALNCDVEDLIPKGIFHPIPKDNIYSTEVYGSSNERVSFNITMPYIPLPKLNNKTSNIGIALCQSSYRKEMLVFEGKILDLETEYEQKIKYAYTLALKMLQQVDQTNDENIINDFLVDLKSIDMMDIKQLNELKKKYSLN